MSDLKAEPLSKARRKAAPGEQRGRAMLDFDAARPFYMDTAGMARSGSRDWQGYLLKEGKKPLGIHANALTAFRWAPPLAAVLGYDTFSERVCLVARPPWDVAEGWAPRPWNDRDAVLAAEWMQHSGLVVKPEVAGQAAEAVAREWPFNPPRDYLESLDHDGIPRLGEWLATYLGAAVTDANRAYLEEIGQKWAIQAVARVLDPGCKADAVLVLEGPQGRRKSTALATLAGPWFSDDLAAVGTKDASQQLAGAWIIELAELDSLARADVSRIKAFMSRRTERFRPAYGRNVIERPRTCVFAATTNADSYLRDETGGRRFWPVKCGAIDVEALARDRDRLWAEAVALYREGAGWWITSATAELQATEEQAARYYDDPWTEPIATWLAGEMTRRANSLDTTRSHPRPRLVQIQEILEGALAHKETAKWSQADMNRVARSLRVLGWARKQVREPDGRRRWFYEPPDSHH